MNIKEIIIIATLSIGAICFLFGGMLSIVYMTIDDEKNHKTYGKISVIGIALLLIGLILIFII